MKKTSSSLPPYPTVIEIVRAVAGAFDFKHSNKKALDGKVYDKNISHLENSKAIKEYFYNPIKKYVNTNIAELISNELEKIISEYLQQIGKLYGDGIDREQMLSILITFYFNHHAAKFLDVLFQKIDGPEPVSLLSENKTAVHVALSWIEMNESGWSQFVNSIDKEKKDRLSAWKRSVDLPSSQLIYLMQGWSKGAQPENIDWYRVRVLLFVARAIDFVRKNTIGVLFSEATRLSACSTAPCSNLQEQVSLAQCEYKNSIAKIIPAVAYIQNNLRLTTVKTSSIKDELYEKILEVRDYFNARKEKESTSYWIDWHEARWHLLSGDINKSSDLYKLAFEHSLFRAGANQELIINEAIVVAANLEKPGMVFLKHLKSASLLFGYDIASTIENPKSSKHSDLIEDWELNMWQSNFDTVFPKQGLFPDAVYESNDCRLGPLLFSDIDSVKPDYRYPNRKLKVGDTWKKSIPQIVFFSDFEKNEVVKKLVEKGAKVNVSSDAGDTAILMALEALNVTEVPYRSLNDELFNLLSQIEHNADTLNKRTQKKRLLPIISAVESCRPDVVNKILDMGADPNGRGKTDEQTALNVCLKLIGKLKDPELSWKNQNDMPITDEVLDSIRRYTAGASGFTLEHQRRFLAKFKSNKASSELRSKVWQVMEERLNALASLENMREIAKILLEYGSNPNAEHVSPLKGYTPLMLAAELDEKDLFDLMLIKAGNPAKSYINPLNGHAVDCWEIASSFRSFGVVNSLDDIKQHFTANPLH